MPFHSLCHLAINAALVSALSTGFNYGNTFSNGSYKTFSTYKTEFEQAKTLQGTKGGFTSARLYTMIQGGTQNDPNEAIQAALDTDTTLLLGMWASEDQSAFENEISALKSAIETFGTALVERVVGLSVGSEDLYRHSLSGVENHAGTGQEPGVLVDYIKQVRAVMVDSGLSNLLIGHVDTPSAWINESNVEVIASCDWLGLAWILILTLPVHLYKTRTPHFGVRMIKSPA